MQQTLRFLSALDVEAALPMDEAIGAMKKAFIQLSAGGGGVPLRITMPVGGDGSCVLIMPAHSPESARVGLKMVSLMKGNPPRGLPLLHGLMVVMDASDGRPLAVMNAESLTGLRTGAASGLATDLLARRDARVGAVIGAGTQGRFQLLGICAVRDLRRVFILDIDGERAAEFVRQMSGRVSAELVAATGGRVLEEADILCTATTSAVPVFSDGRLKPGVHINGVGSYRADTREIPGETVARALVVVDSREASAAEAGDIMIPIREGLIPSPGFHAELGEIASGLKPGRSDEGEVTVFKSVGNAMQDLTAAAHALENAERLGRGVALPF